MRVLITGNMGYVGSVLVRHLRERIPDATLIGYDSGYFAHCLTAADSLPECSLDRQIFGDVRNFSQDHLKGIDAVVHLAAISNDPMGNRFASVTEEINFLSGVAIAKFAMNVGVQKFVFASSCSVYGDAKGGPRKETDPLNPLTAYARSKIAVEQVLSQWDSGPMTITALRFATACGMSERLRLDLVLNDFVACAFSSGKISVLSDGTPWRPLIDVNDMARAIEWALVRKSSEGGHYLSVNVGSEKWNFQVKDIAQAVVESMPGTELEINLKASPDNRSYQVDFSLFRQLAPEYQPKVSLGQTISALKAGLDKMNFSDKQFRNSHLVRLKVLENHILNRTLTDDLRWTTNKIKF